MVDNKKRKLPHRDEGKKFDIGKESDGPLSNMVAIGDDFFIVTRKSIQKLILADVVDPDRENPNIPDTQQKVLSYGSDEMFVGKTLLQANELFKDHCLPVHINRFDALDLSFSFLKEMIVLKETKDSYIKEEQDILASFSGNLDSDFSLRIPMMSNLEQRTKQFIYNADHSLRHIMNLVRLFYPDIEIARGWMDKLQEKLRVENSEDHKSVDFIEWAKGKIIPIRDIRNSVEHPKPNDKVTYQNYTLQKSNKIKPPMMFYKKVSSPFPEIEISQFMNVAIEHLLLSFEGIMVHLCDIQAQPFAGDKRCVVYITEDNRPENNLHMGYKYQIIWTK